MIIAPEEQVCSTYVGGTYSIINKTALDVEVWRDTDGFFVFKKYGYEILLSGNYGSFVIQRNPAFHSDHRFTGRHSFVMQPDQTRAFSTAGISVMNRADQKVMIHIRPGCLFAMQTVNRVQFAWREGYWKLGIYRVYGQPSAIYPSQVEADMNFDPVTEASGTPPVAKKKNRRVKRRRGRRGVGMDFDPFLFIATAGKVGYCHQVEAGPDDATVVLAQEIRDALKGRPRQERIETLVAKALDDDRMLTPDERQELLTFHAEHRVTEFVWKSKPSPKKPVVPDLPSASVFFSVSGSKLGADMITSLPAFATQPDSVKDPIREAIANGDFLAREIPVYGMASKAVDTRVVYPNTMTKFMVIPPVAPPDTFVWTSVYNGRPGIIQFKMEKGDITEASEPVVCLTLLNRRVQILLGIFQFKHLMST